MTVLATRIAALSEILFAALIAAFVLSIPLQSYADEFSTLLMLVVQAALALLAAAGLFRRTRWGWLVALCLIALVFGPLGYAIYRAWRAGVGVGVSMPSEAVRLVAFGWSAQLVVAICFLVARGKRAPTLGTP
jgi:hypothetical protein